MSFKPLPPVGAPPSPQQASGAALSALTDAAGNLATSQLQQQAGKLIGKMPAGLADPLMSGTAKAALAMAQQATAGMPAQMASMAEGTAGRTVTVSSPAMPQLLGQPALRFLKMKGEETLGQLYEYTLELRTPDDQTVPLMVSANLSLKALIGQDMTVTIQLDGMGSGMASGIGAGEREISGLVITAGFLRRERRYNVYQVTLRPWLWLATQTTDFKIFQDKSVIDILDEVLADYPYPVEKRLDPGKYGVKGDSTRNEPRAFQVQYGETDFNLMQRLTQEWGIYWFFEHSEGKHRLILCDHVGAHRNPDSAAYHTLVYQPEDGKPDREYVREFNTTEMLRPGQYTHSDYDFTRPIADLKAIHRQPRDHSLNNAEIYEWPGDYTDSKHADLISRVRMEELRAEGTRANGKGNIRGLACGQTFTLTGHTHDAANQEYLVITSALTLSDIGEDSGSGHQYQCDNRFLVQPTSEVYRPPRDTPKPHVAGPQSAMVVGPQSEELWTDEFGRVKVRFLWDRYARGDESDSCWVRVNQAWAGSGFGGIFIPRIGQEVVLEFMGGDPDKPLIMGALYNSRTRPPWNLPGNATQSGFMSRSMKGGPSNFNGMRFEDKQGAEEFMVQAEKDMNTLVKNNRTKTIGADETTTITGNRNETLGGSHSETITGAMALTVSNAPDESGAAPAGDGPALNITVSSGDIALTATTGNINLTAGKSIELTATDTITLHVGDSTITLDKGGQITVLGPKMILLNE